MLADDSDREQEDFVATMTAELKYQKEEADDLERFIEKVHKYFDLQELTSTILNMC